MMLVPLAAATLAGSTTSHAQTDSKTVATDVMATFIVAGAIDPNHKVPALNAVQGAGVANVAVAFPIAVLKHGTQYIYTLGSQNTTFAGTCQDTYKLTQVQNGKVVTLDSGVIVNSYNCTANTVWFWYISGNPVPDAPGIATLTGTISYGTKKVSTKLTVLIQ